MSSVTILHNYYKQYSALCTYAQLKELLYSGSTTMTPYKVAATEKGIITAKKPLKRTRKTVKETTMQSIIIQHNPNDLITINNDPYLAMILNNFRKQTSPLAYTFYNRNTSSLVVIMKNPIGFPIILINIPNDMAKQNLCVSDAFVHGDVCYELPLRAEIFKSTSAKTHINYLMKYVLTDCKIRFYYQYIAGASKPVEFNVDNIKDVEINALFNQFISDKVDKLGLICGTDTFDGLSRLNNMTLNIISQQNGTDTFNTSDSTKSKNRIVISATNLSFVQQNTAAQSVHELCEKNKSIRWNINFNGLNANDKEEFEFELYEFSNMFKNNYSKQLLQSENRIIYYAFGQFHEDIYTLVRIITSKELDPEIIQTYTIANLFNDDFTTKEVYVCRTLNTFK